MWIHNYFFTVTPTKSFDNCKTQNRETGIWIRILKKSYKRQVPIEKKFKMYVYIFLVCDSKPLLNVAGLKV